MALTVGGFHKEAMLAYQWLADTQLPDGSWFNYYLAGCGREGPRLDTNVCAYVATGAWHHFRVTGDTVGAAVDVADARQGPRPSCCASSATTVPSLWSVDPDGRPGRYPLLTGSSSIYHALRCGVACAEALGDERPDWELAAGRLAHAIAHTPEVFEPKHEFAMDWYYPVLSGALSGRRRRGPHRRRGGTPSCMDGPRGAVRVDGPVGHRRGDGRMRTGPRRRRARRRGAGPAHLGAGAPLRGRLVLDGDRLPREGDVPLLRAHHVHRRRHRAGRRRSVERHAGRRAVPGRVAARRARPHRASAGRRHPPEHPQRPAVAVLDELAATPAPRIHSS